MLKLSNLSTSYGSTPVLNNISLEVGKGEMIAVLGRNGVGKTTLLKAIAGLLPSHTGTINLGNKAITKLPAYQRARCGIGYVPQGREIFSSLTVKENILTAQHKRIKSLEHHLEWLWELFPMLANKANDRGDSLSGGQQQQLAIARALVSRPQLLLLDEPSDGIQPSIVFEITEQLKQINRLTETTFILVEQNLEVVQSLSQQVYIMVKGEIVHNLPTHDLSVDSLLLQDHLGV